jgi:hypothetical protein
MQLFPWLLFLHIFGAIIAFGPSFSMPIIGRMGGAEPQHGNFATRLSEAISKERIFPLAILQGITGVGLILTGNVDLTKALWLDVAIVLYIIAISYAYFVQTPTVHAVIKMTSGSMPAPSEGGPRMEPPVALLALIRKVQQGGMLLAGLITVIVFLMVVKPGS